MTEFFGILAGTMITVSFLPQVIKTLKTKRTDHIYLPMFLIFGVGVVCWIIYGFLILAPSLIIANLITLILVLVILYFKFNIKEEIKEVPKKINRRQPKKK